VPFALLNAPLPSTTRGRCSVSDITRRAGSGPGETGMAASRQPRPTGLSPGCGGPLRTWCRRSARTGSP
jgi:hypothetical protein